MTRDTEHRTDADADALRLIRRLGEAAAGRDVRRICADVERILMDEVRARRMVLPPGLAEPSSDDASCYARRLLHHDPDDRFSVVVMVWGPRQGTPIHDHAGKWCVECVYRGRIRVTSYDLVRDDADGANGGSAGDAGDAADVGDDTVQFRRVREIRAGVGEAGALIPPFDYHVIDNPFDDTAVTIHVYGGAMEGCHVFAPVAEGASRYRREWRTLGYASG